MRNFLTKIKKLFFKKDILHLKIPLLESGRKDDLAISPELLGQFITIIRKELGDSYYIITSPFEVSILKINNMKNMNIISDDLTTEMLSDIIEKYK